MRRGLLESRSAAQRAIAESRVVVVGTPTPSPATLVAPTTDIRLADTAAWASRAGAKLAEAIDVFDIDVTGARCLDVGASTGGFTDVLLHEGAAEVVAVDVGYGQLLSRLAQDPRVTVVDRTNFRTVEPGVLGEPFDVVVVDVSFISIRLLAENLARSGREGTEYVVLVKPQFELGKEAIGKGGIVRDAALHRVAVGTVADALESVGIGSVGVAASPITGARGNREFLLHGTWGATTTMSTKDYDEVTA